MYYLLQNKRDFLEQIFIDGIIDKDYYLEIDEYLERNKHLYKICLN